MSTEPSRAFGHENFARDPEGGRDSDDDMQVGGTQRHGLDEQSIHPAVEDIGNISPGAKPQAPRAGTQPSAQFGCRVERVDDGVDLIHWYRCMKTITVNVSEPVYEDFQRFAQKMDRKASELIREAMEAYRQQHMLRRTSLRDRRPASVGGPIQPITSEDDLLGEMLHDLRD
jgi:hypothetical protein